ncbi:hypothetical protein KP79_PYT12185 [Mizuhopecten yessoensis]|uniref:DUF4218 domain-containing protein n=1 Tax=Mizuhopecten yessoensis TaxID=6573 RepID=A0A210PPT1_MIZYE|nr:hypothetical protein KP79_PYT12185 [Mizuhopecten yessoensis]
MNTRQLSMSAMDRIESTWYQSLALMERDFPCSIQGAVMHIMHHLPHYLRKFGPVSNFWMFPFERLDSTLSRAIGSARYLELAAVKHMKIQWMMSMLQAAG